MEFLGTFGVSKTHGDHHSPMLSVKRNGLVDNPHPSQPPRGTPPSPSTVLLGSIRMSPQRPSRESVLKRLSDALLRRSLTQIDLSQRGLQPSDARLVKMALLQNAHLTCLKLGYNMLGDTGVSLLAKGIAQHEALESLDLGFNNLGDDGCRELCSALETVGTLHTLYLAGNLIGADGAMSVADLIRKGCRLRKLYLTGNRVGPDGVKAIVEAVIEDELQHQDSDQPIQERVTCKNQGGLEELFLGGTDLGSSGCRAVARMLRSTTHLTVLSLPNCDIDDESVARIASSIKANRERLPLTSLQLSFNLITCKGMECLANAVWGSTTLVELLLDNNQIADRGAQQFAAVLPYVKTLQTLNLGFNCIKSSGIRLLLKAVPEMQNLSTLSLSGNTIDTEAAKAVAYALAYNRSLVSLSLVNSSIGHEGRRHITAGVVSNTHLSLRELTGFSLGTVIVTLGFPAALEHWNNDQILNFIQLMWDRCGHEVAASEEEKKMDPLHFLDDPMCDSDDQDCNRRNHVLKRSPPLEASVVVEVAKKTFAALVEDGVDVFSRRVEKNELASPIVDDDRIVVESSSTTEPSSFNTTVHEEGPVAEDRPWDAVLEPMPTCKTPSFVAPPEAVKPAAPDPARKKRIVEWLCSHIQHLNKLGQMPFSSADLWRLHQHYFTPVVNESGGRLGQSFSQDRQSSEPVGITVSSVPEVSRSNSNDYNSMDPLMHDLSDEALAAVVTVPASDPSMQVSPPGLSPLPVLKRKVSYRFLGDATVQPASQPNTLRTEMLHQHIKPLSHSQFQHGAMPSVAQMISCGPTGHSMPPKNKRARRNRSRISFLPRIKAKLDSYLDVCHEKALATMRQLYFVEQEILSGRVNPIDPSTTTRTHLCGAFAADAETIIVDML